jgi:hypothetical protein
MRYVDLRDWRGGLLLRCPAASERSSDDRLSRIACGPIFDCALSLAPPTPPYYSGAHSHGEGVLHDQPIGDLFD